MRGFPQILDKRYEFVRLLGDGGQAQVAAYDCQGELFAVK